MDALSTHRLRARIARLVHDRPDLRPDDLARRVGCARSTVYKFLRAPGRDRRTAGLRRPARTDPAVLAAVRRLAIADPTLSAPALHAALVARTQIDPNFPPVPTARTVRRLLARLRTDRDTSSSTAQPGRAGAADATATAPEAAAAIDALRVLLKEVLAELDTHPLGSPARFRLRQQAVAVAAALARADHLRPAVSSVTSALALHLDAVADDLLAAAEQAARPPEPTAPPETPTAESTPEPVSDRPQTSVLSDALPKSAT